MINLLKEDFNNWYVGMTVYLIPINRPMAVKMFFMDDFCEDHFCDRLECSWRDEDGNEQKAIFSYGEVELEPQ